MSYDVVTWIDTSKLSDQGSLVTCGWCAVAACGGANYTLKREQKVVHETFPTDILKETRLPFAVEFSYILLSP